MEIFMNITRSLNSLARLKIILLIFSTILSPEFSVAGGGPSKEVDADRPVISRPVERSIPVVPAATGGAGGGTSAYTHGETAADARPIRSGTIQYTWDKLPSISPVVGSGPVAAPIGAVGASSDHPGAPSSIWNDWGDNVQNTSIFHYLLEDAFVKDWYKSSCAIVYYASDGAHIIGTGSYVDGNKVATARHCFERFAIESLYARFFHYKVNSKGIEAIFIDVPVLRKAIANGGLDAGYLFLTPINESLARTYTRILPVTRDPVFDDDFATLPEGQYAMFHFADGVHQISTGDVPPPPPGAAFIHNNIPIEAGSGASGATVIRSTGPKDVQAYGISIYRLVRPGTYSRDAERRVIPFAKFELSGWTGSISAPYSMLGCVEIISNPYDEDEDGYEYLKWLRDFEGIDKDKPGSKVYGVASSSTYGVDPSSQQNHHIIPRGDLWFLWEYFFTGPSTELIKEVVLREQLDAKRVKRAFDFDSKFAELLASEKVKYLPIKKMLEQLSPDWDAANRFARRFSWSYWNLFQGWQGASFREDDPAKVQDAVHGRSEKQKPNGFDEKLWDALKKPYTGLYFRIQSLKEASKIGLPDPSLLEALGVSLRNLCTIWFGLPAKERIIHPFNPNEWILSQTTGKYRVKPTA
jgi:hypothetical protein